MKLKAKHKQTMLLVGMVVMMLISSFYLYSLIGHKADNHIDMTEAHANIFGDKSNSESNLLESEEYYREILKDKKNIVLALGMDGVVDFASKEYKEKLGVELEDLVGDSFFLQLHSEDLAIFTAAFGAVIQDREPVSAIGPYRLKKNNGEFEMHIGYVAPYLVGGKVTKVLFVTKSIEDKIRETEEKNVKKNIQEIKKHIEQRLIVNK